MCDSCRKRRQLLGFGSRSRIYTLMAADDTWTFTPGDRER